MRKLLWLIALFPLISAAEVYEAGASAGQVFLERSGMESESENHMRLALHGGYQFNSQSDQLLVSFISDRKVDELQLGYALTLPTLRPYAPFSSLPYVKASIGLGNTYADSPTLTHLSLGVSVGAYGMITSRLRLRFEIEHRSREWQLDRSGGDASVTAETWQDSELGFHLGAGYLF